MKRENVNSSLTNSWVFLLNLNLNFNSSIKLEICSNVNCSNIFDTFVNILVSFFFFFFQFSVFFLKHCCYICLITSPGKGRSSDGITKAWKKEIWKKLFSFIIFFLRKKFFGKTQQIYKRTPMLESEKLKSEKLFLFW